MKQKPVHIYFVPTNPHGLQKYQDMVTNSPNHIKRVLKSKNKIILNINIHK